MSRITKFLRQTCSVQPYQTDDSGKPALNDFGEILYKNPIKCKCRYESSYQDVQTSNGQLVKSTSRYYLDEHVELKVDYLIDGLAILAISTYTNAQGLTEGYEVYV